MPSTADCCSRSAHTFSKEGTSSHTPKQFSHSSIVVVPIATETMAVLQRGHLRGSGPLTSGTTAAAPQRWQCRLPRNINAKHDGQAIVARREPQNWQVGPSVAVAAPQLGQLRVSACIATHFSSCIQKWTMVTQTVSLRVVRRTESRAIPPPRKLTVCGTNK